MVIPTLEMVQRRAQRFDGRVEHLRDWPSKMGYGSQATESEVGIIRDWPSKMGWQDINFRHDGT